MPASSPPDASAAGFMVFEYFDTARALAMFGSAQSFRKILQMALDSLGTDVEKIEALLQAGDLKAASHLLHGIKGFAPIFCGDALSARIAEVERSSKIEAIEPVRNAYRDLMPALLRWGDEMRQYLTDSSGASVR